MKRHLRIKKAWLERIATLFAVIPMFAAPVAGQSITVELLPGTFPACAIPVDVSISTSGLPADSTTLGSATIDIIYDETLVEPIDADDQLDPNAYSTQTPTLPESCTIGVDCTRVRVRIEDAGVGPGLGGEDGVEITSPVTVEKLCFDFVSPATSRDISAKSAAIVLPSFIIDTTTASVGFFDDLDNNDDDGVIRDCRTPPQSPGDIGFDCTLVNLIDLPVELAEFTATVAKGDVLLSWTTESEVDNAGFSVEHAVGDDGTFEEIGFVEGAGTSIDSRTYSFTVKGLDIGKHRFRLKQLDYDGAITYSQVVEATIELAGTHRLSAAYPNPFNPSTTFELVVGREQNVRIEIINALGQRVERLFDGAMEANQPTNFTFRAGNLPTGLYFYRVIGETFAQTRQVLLVK